MAKLSEEARRKRSEAMKKKWQDPAWRAKIKAAKEKSGKPQGWAAMTEEQRQAFKEKRKTWSPRKGMKNTPEQNAKIGAANAIALAGRPLPKGAIEKGHRVRWSDPEARQRQAEAMEKYRDPETGQFLPKEAVDEE